MKSAEIVPHPDQLRFVHAFIQQQGRLLLVAPRGSGKTTAAIAALAELGTRRPASVLLIASSDPASRSVQAALRSRGLRAPRITKRWLRSTAGDATADRRRPPLFASVSLPLLQDSWAARELLSIHWDAVVVDDAEVAVDDPYLQRWLEGATADRVAFLANAKSPRLLELADSTIEWEFSQLVQNRVTLTMVTFRRDRAEVDLLEEVALLDEPGVGEYAGGIAEVQRAARSSPFALQAAALKQVERLRPIRNALAHGRTGDSSPVFERSDDLGTAMRLDARLEAIVDAVDGLQYDARFEALYRLMLDLKPTTQSPVIIHVSEPRTADYVADRLRFQLISATSEEASGAGIDDEEHAARVVPDDAIDVLLSSTARRVVFYDAGSDRKASDARWATLRNRDHATEAWQLVDTSPAGDNESWVRATPDWVVRSDPIDFAEANDN